MITLSRADALLVSVTDTQPWLSWLERVYLTQPSLPSIRTVDAARRAMGDSRWATICRIANLYQIWTRESVRCLVTSLRHANARIVLEVGAGDGRLVRALSHLGDSPYTVVGQDDGSWAGTHHVGSAVTSLRIESIDQSLMTVQPDTVIVSWMPYQTDWTPLFRACPSVRQYLVIGEDEGGCTGIESVFHPPDPWCIRRVPSFQPVAASRTDVALGSMTHLWRVWRPV